MAGSMARGLNKVVEADCAGGSGGACGPVLICSSDGAAGSVVGGGMDKDAIMDKGNVTNEGRVMNEGALIVSISFRSDQFKGVGSCWWLPEMCGSSCNSWKTMTTYTHLKAHGC